MLKRLIRKAEDGVYQDENNDGADDFLGKWVEIVYTKSKWIGYNGYVDEKIRSGNKYRVFLQPQNFEQNQDNWHIAYVSVYDAYKWFRVLPDEEAQENG